MWPPTKICNAKIMSKMWPTDKPICILFAFNVLIKECRLLVIKIKNYVVRPLKFLCYMKPLFFISTLWLLFCHVCHESSSSTLTVTCR